MPARFLNPSTPFEKKPVWYVYLIWAVIGASCAAALTWLFNITGLVEDSSFREAAAGLFGLSSRLYVLAALYCIITPTLEEVFFRFLLFGFIYGRTGKPRLSIIAAAAAFGLYHLNPVQILYGFLMGLVITYGYYRHRNLLIPIIAHSAANAVALLFTFL